MNKKARYSDEELEEFRSIINDKLKVARTEYTALMDQLTTLHQPITRYLMKGMPTRARKK